MLYLLMVCFLYNHLEPGKIQNWQIDTKSEEIAAMIQTKFTILKNKFLSYKTNKQNKT